MSPNVEYREIPNFPSYKAGNDGSVWLLRRNGKWVQVRPQGGPAIGRPYFTITLRNDDGPKTFSLHTLIITSFRGPRPEGMECRHLDGVATNCAIDNLIYGTRRQNMKDKLLHGTQPMGEAVFNSKLTNEQVSQIRIKRAGGASLKSLAVEFGISLAGAGLVATGRTWAHIQTPPVAPKTHMKGEDNPMAKMSEDTAKHIIHLAASGTTLRAISDLVGHTYQTVWDVVRGKTWKYLKRPEAP